MVDLPILSSRILVFSDFNCPYCFTLAEWIAEANAAGFVRWIGIEHRPDLPSAGRNAPGDVALLDREVQDIRVRAPEVGVQRPPAWWNSQRVLLLQNSVEVDLPEQAGALRQKIFRHYWHEGLPFSDIAAPSGVEVDLEFELEELDRLTQWWREHLDRIPAMFAPTGAQHLGLQDRAAVERFLNTALESGSGPGCR